MLGVADVLDCFHRSYWSCLADVDVIAKVVAEKLNDRFSTLQAKLESLETSVGHMDSKIDEKVAAARRCISPEAEERCSLSACALVNGKTAKAKQIGVAFAISETRAVTAHHVVAPFIASGKFFLYGFTERDERVKFRILPPADADTALDVCALSIEEDGRKKRSFVELTTTIPGRGSRVAVVGFQLALQEHIADTFPLKLGIMEGTVSKASSNHVLLQTVTFSGDSGAAMMLFDGKMFAMNVEGVNAAKERLQHKSMTVSKPSLKARVTAVEGSVDSLVADTQAGSIGVLAKCVCHVLGDPEAAASLVAASAGAGGSGAGRGE